MNESLVVKFESKYINSQTNLCSSSDVFIFTLNASYGSSIRISKENIHEINSASRIHV